MGFPVCNQCVKKFRGVKMESRGKKLLGLTKKLPSGSRIPLQNLSSNVPRSDFELAMDKCRKYLSNLKSPIELRRMTTPELSVEKPLYIDEEEASANVEEADKELGVEEANDVPEVVDSQAEPISGHVSFGDMGFMNVWGNRESEDIDQNSNLDDARLDETEVNEPNFAVASVSGENEPTVVDSDSPVADINTEENQPVETVEKETLPKKSKKKTNKKAKDSRIDILKIKKTEKKPPKSDRAAKKGFKDNFLTIKFKLSDVQARAGTIPDFALFLKDNVHSPDAKPSAPHAGKYLAYIQGDITDKFFSKTGISFNDDDYFLCKNEVDLAEDRALPVLKAVEHAVHGAKHDDERNHVGVHHAEVHEESSDEEETGTESDQMEQSDSDVDAFDMAKIAKKVTWGAPERHSESSGSSGGVLVHGRGAQKTLSKDKKKKQSAKKKHAKEAVNRSKTDILEENSDTAGPSSRGSGRGRGRGSTRGRGRGSSRGPRGAKGRKR